MSKKFLYLTVFLCGMAVTAVELTASRLLAPYFGSSLFVWTNIIGVVLLALSLGYYLGGKLADREEGRKAKKHLFSSIFITGLLICLIPVLARPIFQVAYKAVPKMDLSVFIPSLLATLFLFSLPILLLGMVAPLAARLGFKKLNTAGSVVGSLYAFSTVGSIVGTFIPVLATIPFLGSRETFFLFGGLLILLGIVGFRRPSLAVTLALPLFLSYQPSPIHADLNTIFEKESVYNYVRVVQNPKLGSALMFNESPGAQSLYHPERILTGYYWDAVSLLPLLNPQGKDFLILGLAGGTSARVLSHFFPNLELEGVEIDPLVIKVGKRFFGLDRTPIKIIEGDGRIFLERSEKKYDFIMVDVYRDAWYIPFHLATLEFFQTVQSHLTPQGAMFMNVFSLSPDSEMLLLMKNTVRTVFPFVYEYRSDRYKTTMLLAFKEKPNFEQALKTEIPSELKKEVSPIISSLKPVESDPSYLKISRDNNSLVELLSAKMIMLEKF